MFEEPAQWITISNNFISDLSSMRRI